MATQPRPKIRIALYPVERLSPTLKERRALRGAQVDPDIPFSVERVFFLLRWLVVGLGLAIQLYVAGSNSGGVEQVVHALQVTSLMAVLTGLFGVLRYYYTDYPTRRFVAVLDAVAVTTVIGLDRGIYSPYQFLSYLVIAEAALLFSASNILTFTALVGALYAGAVMLISGQRWTELTITIVMSQVVAMFIVASISSSMVRAIKHQRELARREQALAAQLNHQVNALSALNRLSEKLNASLDIEELMRGTMEALPEALEVDACVGFLASREGERWQPGSVWYGIDEAFIPGEKGAGNDDSDLVQLGPLVLSRADLEEVLEKGQPLRFPQILLPPVPEDEESSQEEETRVQSSREPSVLIVPLRSEEGQSGALALLRQNGPAFDQSDQELLAALGRQLSLLIKNARLYDLERQQVARLQELEQMKSDFLSVVSHELRTPLTSIKASTILLLSQPADDLNSTELTLYKNIDRNTERLSALVTDLLDLAKLQNGRLRLSLQPLNLREVVLDAVASIRPLTDNKRQTMLVDMPETVPQVMADRRRAEQIISNLISNAQRYTPRGGRIEVQVGLREGGMLEVAVRDNGPGIDPAEQKLIFEKFYRSQSQNSKTGTGLGLAIARSLAELHSGRIWVESEPGVGSSFYFSLPVISSEFRVPGSELVASAVGPDSRTQTVNKPQTRNSELGT